MPETTTIQTAPEAEMLRSVRSEMPVSAPPVQPRIARSLDAVHRLNSDLQTARTAFRRRVPGNDPDRFAAVIEADAGRSSPFLAVWPGTSGPRAVVLGRCEHRSATSRLGYFNLRLPAMRCLDIVHGGLLVEDDPGTRSTVTSFLASLLADRTVDHISINRLVADDPMRDALAPFRPLESPCQPNWSITLCPNDFDRTMAHHSAKHRSNLRRLDRRLAGRFDGRLQLETYSRSADFDAYVRIVRDITSRTYHARLPKVINHEQRMRGIFEIEAQAGRLLCFVLMGNGEPIAFQSGAVYHGTYYCDGTAYLPEFAEFRPGTVLLHRVIAALCGLDVSEIDFGSGDADYKRLYGTRCRQETTLRMYRRGGRAAWVGTVDRLVDRLHADLARRAATSKFGRRLKTAWRQRLQQTAGNNPVCPGQATPSNEGASP